MDASLRNRAPRRNRKAIKLLIAEMSRVASALRERVANSPHTLTADDFGQMIACGLVTVLANRVHFLKGARWLLDSAPQWQQPALEEIFAAAEVLSEGRFRWLQPAEIESLAAACGEIDWESPDDGRLEAEHLYEQFLSEHAAGQRRRKGVFFTPQPIVRFMLEQVDGQLRDEFGLPEGIASPSAVLLDPAAGAGAFLTEAVTLVHERFIEHRSTTSTAEIATAWNEHVVERLLPRLTGIELMPTSCLLAHLHIVIRLAKTGFDFALPGSIRVELGNALSGPPAEGSEDNNNCLVVLGNPPFSYLSENDSPWIQGLIRGTADAAGYLEFDGERLGERKTWLHDDYVKFLRYAQWRVELAGCGIVAFVTNHGYLDNTTFRILRRQLMRTFPRIAVIDLHGNRKKGEVSPDGKRDENVFGLDQGIAIGFFRKGRGEQAVATSLVEHAELWGSAADKLGDLTQWNEAKVEYAAVSPTAHDYRWLPAGPPGRSEYFRGIRLPEAMAVYTSAPVTARDGLVVAFTADELLARMERFCNLSIPDEQLRQELFPRTRTARYPAGDTRGWKLAEARRLLAAESDLRPFVRRCLYRPFDWRFAFWHEAMIDWPRNAVMRHLLRGRDTGGDSERSNLALIARRQMLPSQPCSYFWVTDTLTLDGVIRSDNRGSEAVFPQWLVASDGEWQLNLVDALPTPLPDPEWFVHWSYALFHAPGYRERYADVLRRDFPRVLLPKSNALRGQMVAIGRKLVDLHLLRSNSQENLISADRVENGVGQAVTGLPRYEEGAVFIQPGQLIARCSPEAWAFRVGGHQVLRKWLVDRRGQSLQSADLHTYGRVVESIEATLALQPAIDQVIDDHGGWEHAFQ